LEPVPEGPAAKVTPPGPLAAGARRRTLTRTSPLAFERRSLILSAESPPELKSPPHDEPPTVSPLSVVPVCCMRWADSDDNAGDRSYLVHARPDVIMNDIRLRGPDAGAAELLPSSSATTRPDPSVGFPELHWHPEC
jgi:hypothetical protein